MSSTFDTIYIIAEACDIPREPSSRKATINDLGIDSLDYLDIAFAISKGPSDQLPLEQWTQEVNDGKATTDQYFVLKNLGARIDTRRCQVGIRAEPMRLEYFQLIDHIVELESRITNQHSGTVPTTSTIFGSISLVFHDAGRAADRGEGSDLRLASRRGASDSMHGLSCRGPRTRSSGCSSGRDKIVSDGGSRP